MRIFGHGPDVVARKTVLIAALTTELTHAIAVITIQTGFGRKPDVPLGVLEYAVDGAHREPISHGQVLKIHRPRRRDRRACECGCANPGVRYAGDPKLKNAPAIPHEKADYSDRGTSTPV